MTDELRILHAADFHLDSSFAGLTPRRAADRRAEQRELLAGIFSLAKKERVKLILFSGDLLDSDNAYYETTDLLRKLCADSDAKIVISPGNHDYFSQTSPYGAMVWPNNVYIFKSSKISAVEFPKLKTRVYGAAFNRTDSAPLMDDFSAADDDYINLMCIHGNCGGLNYNPVSKENILGSGLDYLALGHIHSFSGILKLGATFFAYPGCPEGRGFDETGEKGVIVGTVSKRAAELRFVPMSRRRYEVTDIDLTGRENDVSAAVAEALPDDTFADIYRLRLTGKTAAAPDTAALYKEYEERFFGLEIRDKTERPVDIWVGEAEMTLRGEFLRRMREIWKTAKNDDEREQTELAVRFGLAALDKREAPRA